MSPGVSCPYLEKGCCDCCISRTCPLILPCYQASLLYSTCLFAPRTREPCRFPPSPLKQWTAWSTRSAREILVLHTPPPFLRTSSTTLLSRARQRLNHLANSNKTPRGRDSWLLRVPTGPLLSGHWVIVEDKAFPCPTARCTRFRDHSSLHLSPCQPLSKTPDHQQPPSSSQREAVLDACCLPQLS